jgi:hypothetical protein
MRDLAVSGIEHFHRRAGQRVQCPPPHVMQQRPDRSGESKMEQDQQKQCPWHSGMIQQQADHERRLNLLEGAILDIRMRLLGRPSWVVVAMLTLESAAVVGLLVAMLKG